MNRGFIGTLTILTAGFLGMAAGPAKGMVACTVESCCGSEAQCRDNHGFCCMQSPLPCGTWIQCGNLSEQPLADPVLAGSPPAQGLSALLGPLSADSRSFGVDDLRKLHRPAANLD